MYLRPTKRAGLQSRPPVAPVPNWSRLTRDDVVQVLGKDGTATTGRIDMIAVDRSVFWIIQNDGRGRVMVCSADQPIVIKTAKEVSSL
jgi:hypothetical protein